MCRCTEQTVTTPAPQITTTTSFPSIQCVYNLIFENSQQILVVKENVGFASVTIKIEPSHPSCVWQKAVSFKVSSKKYTATEGADYQGKLDIEKHLNTISCIMYY